MDQLIEIIQGPIGWVMLALWAASEQWDWGERIWAWVKAWWVTRGDDDWGPLPPLKVRRRLDALDRWNKDIRGRQGGYQPKGPPIHSRHFISPEQLERMRTNFENPASWSGNVPQEGDTIIFPAAREPKTTKWTGGAEPGDDETWVYPRGSLPGDYDASQEPWKIDWTGKWRPGDG